MESKPEKKLFPTQGMSLKEKIDFYFNDLKTPIGKLVDFGIIFLILVLCVTFVVSTYVSDEVQNIIYYIELGIIIIFIMEYLLRFWVAQNKLKHFFNIYSIIDLVSILPFFFTLANLQFTRIFRMFRILRLLRFLNDQKLVSKNIKDDNFIIAKIIFTIFAIIFVSSGLIYYEEHDVKGSTIKSFFDAVYFSIVTLTTVGYGDITAVTPGGRVITILMILSGVIFLPWQIGSLIRRFALNLNKADVTCKICGLKGHDKDASHCKACGSLIYQEYESDSL